MRNYLSELLPLPGFAFHDLYTRTIRKIKKNQCEFPESLRIPFSTATEFFNNGRGDLL
jgi:hypothetical protein